MKNIKIADKVLGEHKPCFIIAEAGVNHNGSVVLAKRLIDAAKNAGADAVKFQAFRAEKVVIKDAVKAEYQKDKKRPQESQYEMIKKLELREEDFGRLFRYAARKKIIFLSSPFDRDSVDMLDELGVPAFKVASGEITNFPLLEHIAKKGKPIILSTGMSNIKEIKETLRQIKKKHPAGIMLLHCVTSYPARPEDMNLRAMETMKKVFGVPVGLSDHTSGAKIAIAAVALGACVIEKHFTLDKKLPGPDHKVSLSPEELKEMIRSVREVEKSLGNGIKKCTASEKEIKLAVRRSVIAAVDIPKSNIIEMNMLEIKRPGTGIQPKYLYRIVGGRAKKDIKQDAVISPGDFQEKRHNRKDETH